MHLALALSIVTTASAARAAPCQALQGAAELVSDVDFVVVGEVPGTAEIPPLFLDVVCAAVETARPVIVGIEHGGDNQPALAAYLASDGGPEARAALLEAPAWSVRDGRSSEAMLDLVEGVRSLKAAGKDVALIAFDHVIPEPGTTDAREAAMATSLTEAQARSGGLVLVLTGQGHADQTAFTRTTPPFPSMVRRLPSARSRSVVIARAPGDIWACRPRQAGGPVICGSHAIPPPPQPMIQPVERGIKLADQAGFNGVATAADRLTTSPPARPEE